MPSPWTFKVLPPRESTSWLPLLEEGENELLLPCPSALLEDFFSLPVLVLIWAWRYNMVLSIKHLDRKTRVSNSFLGSFPNTEIGEAIVISFY